MLAVNESFLFQLHDSVKVILLSGGLLAWHYEQRDPEKIIFTVQIWMGSCCTLTDHSACVGIRQVCLL